MRCAPVVLALSVVLAAGGAAGAAPGEVSAPNLAGCVEDAASTDHAGPPLGTYPQGMTTSVPGETIFVSGGAHDAGWLRESCVAFAFSSASAELRWEAECSPSDNRDLVPQDMAPAPDGSAIYLTGTSWGAEPEIATVALDARDGRWLWLAREGRESGAIAVDPRGRRVYVTGSSAAAGVGRGALYIAARDASSGAPIWRTETPVLASAAGLDVVVSGDGGAVYVLAAAADRAGMTSARISRHDAATGAVSWLAMFDEPGEHYRSGPMVLSVDGGVLYTAGCVSGPGGPTRFVRALDTERGTVLWTRARHRSGEPCAMALAAGGSTLLVGACDDLSEPGLEALDAATGNPSWPLAPRVDGGVDRIAVSGDGRRAAVLSGHRTRLEVRDARSGAVIWSARYPLTGRPVDLAFDPLGTTLFVPAGVEDDGRVRVRLSALRECAGRGELAPEIALP